MEGESTVNTPTLSFSCIGVYGNITNHLQTRTRSSTRTRLPQVGLREASSATTNSRSGIMAPGTIANNELTSPEATRPKTANPETKRPGSVTRQPSTTTRVHTRGNSYSSSTMSRPTAPTTRAANGSFSSTVGPGTRPATAMSRHQSSFNGRRPVGASIPRAASALDTHMEDASPSVLGKRKGPEWDQASREKSMEGLMQTIMAQVNQQGQASSGLKDTVELYKSRINELEASRDELKELNITQRVELDSLRNQLYAAEQARKEFTREHEIAMDDLCQRHRIELDSLQQQSSREIATVTDRHQEEVRDLKRRFDREIEDEKAARVSALGKLTSQSALDIQKSQIELERKDREITTLQDGLQARKADLDRERRTVQELKLNLDTASSNSVTLESSIRALKARIEFLESGREEQSKSFERCNQQMMDAFAETEAIKEKLRREETLRRKLHNQVQELKGNIRVFCRVRPSLNSEPASDLTLMQYPDEAEDGKEINILGPEEKSSLGTVNRKNNTFSFDRVFNPSAQNAEVFDEISQLVQSALDGYNVCIFCYGQTGSGKTHTMSSADGMIPRAVHQIYETAQGLEEKGWRYSMAGNFVEVYNENLNDLLGNPDELDKKKHEIRHDMQRGKTTITDITTVNLDSPEMVESILKNADANRSVAATKANERSSRSHSVFILKLTGQNHITGERSEGTLNLVDLAGSERLSHSGATGERLKETQNINRSLSSLGDVISALGQGKEGGHIPYRNSKLTYLLQFSLGGNSKTLMFVMVSPLQAHMSETLTSLKFATKVHNTHIGTAKRQARVRDA
ncbi:Pc12g13070 [Penicillium rubens Wisconsin 54-1255]|uniref:Kinesin-like protein n=1 Tax=Penicillium rubens (strain ATCC 28089 / DSM 1075 / NRRL 1951 / Wisconsin 54-1255) TaxID=500485 RepID=B6GZJ1_PENRW|nr:Pc12g13070 [Penicillium rubens Wisconsin 54-1255]